MFRTHVAPIQRSITPLRTIPLADKKRLRALTAAAVPQRVENVIRRRERLSREWRAGFSGQPQGKSRRAPAGSKHVALDSRGTAAWTSNLLMHQRTDPEPRGPSTRAKPCRTTRQPHRESSRTWSPMTPRLRAIVRRVGLLVVIGPRRPQSAPVHRSDVVGGWRWSTSVLFMLDGFQTIARRRV